MLGRLSAARPPGTPDFPENGRLIIPLTGSIRKNPTHKTRVWNAPATAARLVRGGREFFKSSPGALPPDGRPAAYPPYIYYISPRGAPAIPRVPAGTVSPSPAERYSITFPDPATVSPGTPLRAARSSPSDPWATYTLRPHNISLPLDILTGFRTFCPSCLVNLTTPKIWAMIVTSTCRCRYRRHSRFHAHRCIPA